MNNYKLVGVFFVFFSLLSRFRSIIKISNNDRKMYDKRKVDHSKQTFRHIKLHARKRIKIITISTVEGENNKIFFGSDKPVDYLLVGLKSSAFMCKYNFLLAYGTRVNMSVRIAQSARIFATEGKDELLLFSALPASKKKKRWLKHFGSR